MSVVRNLKKNYGDFTVQFTAWEILEKGVTALWGPSGSGKTSILRLLLGLDTPSPGFSWEFTDGTDLAKLTPPERRLGIVFQTYDLFPHMTVSENILFAAEARKIARSESAETLQTLSKILNLKSILDRKAAVLSGGEKQRVALARAVLSKPRILLLDEPFSALDPDLRSEARKLVSDTLISQNIPAILVTHDRDDLETLASKVTEIAAGTLVKEWLTGR